MYRDIVSNPFLAHYNWQCATWCFGKNSLQKPIIISSKMEKSHKIKYYLLNGLIRTLVRLSTMHWQWATWCEGRSSRRTPWRWRRCHGPGTGPTASACACSCCTIRTVEYYGFSRTNCQKKTVIKCSKTISSALTTRNACKFVLYAIFLCQPVWPNKLLYIKNTIVVFLLYKNISIWTFESQQRRIEHNSIKVK